MGSLVDMALRDYGPNLMVLVVILVMWKYIMMPLLQDRKIDNEAMQLVANTLKDSATILATAIDKLDSITSKLERVSND